MHFYFSATEFECCIFFLIWSKSTNIENRVQIRPILCSSHTIRLQISFRVSDKHTYQWYIQTYFLELGASLGNILLVFYYSAFICIVRYLFQVTFSFYKYNCYYLSIIFPTDCVWYVFQWYCIDPLAICKHWSSAKITIQNSIYFRVSSLYIILYHYSVNFPPIRESRFSM